MLLLNWARCTETLIPAVLGTFTFGLSSALAKSRRPWKHVMLRINGLFPNAYCSVTVHLFALPLRGSPTTPWVIITHYCFTVLFIPPLPRRNSSFIHVTVVIYYVVLFVGGRNEQFYATFGFLASHSATLILFLHLPWHGGRHLQGEMIAGYWQAALRGSRRECTAVSIRESALSQMRKDVWAGVQGPLMGSGIRMVICIRVGRSAACVFIYKELQPALISHHSCRDHQSLPHGLACHVRQGQGAPWAVPLHLWRRKYAALVRRTDFGGVGVWV